MSNYSVRKAKIKDIPFLAEVVIAAEKGNTNMLGYSTLFNLKEEEVKNLIISMFSEEIEGCELYYGNYLIIESNNKNVAAFGSWIECFNNLKPSKILKSNLISYCIDFKNLEYFTHKSFIIKDLIALREPLTLQLEYLFVNKDHRGEGLATKLIQCLEQEAIVKYPLLSKIQVQVFSNNIKAINLYMKNGFKIGRSLKSRNKQVFDYLPFNQKHIMEKKINY